MMISIDSIVEREIHLISLLSQLADRKRQALIQNDLGELRRVTELEEAAAKELKQLEEARLHQAGLFSNKSIYDDELRQRVFELKEKNDFNQALLGDALAYTRFMLQTIAGTGMKPTVYGAEGKVQDGTAQRIFDGRG